MKETFFAGKRIKRRKKMGGLSNGTVAGKLAVFASGAVLGLIATTLVARWLETPDMDLTPDKALLEFYVDEGQDEEKRDLLSDELTGRKKKEYLMRITKTWNAVMNINYISCF